MLPAFGGGVGQQIVGHQFADCPEMRGSIGDVRRVPIYDRGDYEVQSRRPELLGLVSPIRDAPLLERADRLCQGVALLALVEPGLTTLAQFRALESVEQEQGALDPADFLQREVEFILAFVGGELA